MKNFEYRDTAKYLATGLINFLVVFSFLFVQVPVAESKGRLQNEDFKTLDEIKEVAVTTGTTTAGSVCLTNVGSLANIRTGYFVYNKLNPLFIPTGTTVVAIPGTCSGAQIQMSQAALTSGSAQTITFGGGAAQLLQDSKVYIGANGINDSLSNAITNGLIGGGGGDGGVNLLSVQNGNPDFEQGTTGWTSSNGTLTQTPATDILYGRGSMTVTPNGSAGWVRSPLVTVTPGMKNLSGTGRIYYTGGDASYTLKILDGSGNTVSTRALQAGAPNRLEWATPLFFGAVGTQYRISLEWTAGIVTPIILDRTKIGEVGFSGFSTTGLVAAGYFPTNAGCSFSTTAGVLTDLSSASCLAPIVTAGQGPASVDTATGGGIAFTVNNLEPGTYEVRFDGQASNTGAGSTTGFQIKDGLTTSPNLQYMWMPSSGSGPRTPVIAHFTYSGPQTSRRFTLAMSGGGGTPNFNNSGGYTTQWSIHKVAGAPGSTILTPQTTGWMVDAYVTGDNIGIGGAVTAYRDNTSTATTVTTNPGSVSVGAACSTGASTVGTSTACASNTRANGITFNVPQAGKVLICTNFSNFIETSGSGYSENYFKFVEASSSNSATTLQEGTAKFPIYFRTVTNAGSTAFPAHFCDTMNFASAGQKTVKLQSAIVTISNVATNNIIMNGDVNSGSRNMTWTVTPLTQNTPMPVMVGPFGESRTVSATTTLSPSDRTVFLDATAGAFTATLPSAVGLSGKTLKLKRKDVSTNVVTISPFSGQTISGEATLKFGTSGDGVELESDGINWLVHTRSARRVALLQDVEPQNTGIEGHATGAWQSRRVNTLTDPTGIVQNPTAFTGSSGANKQFTLGPGTYRVTGEAMMLGQTAANVIMRARILNVTDSIAPTNYYGVNVYHSTASGQGPGSPAVPVRAFITISATKTFQMETFTNGNYSGASAENLAPETYVNLEIEKID